jgi:hypothetical protein
MRRSFRTLRLCAIPGVSPRAGMQCPVGALRTPRLPRAPAPEPQHTCSATIIFPHRQQSTTPIEGQALNQPSSSGLGPERALEAIKPLSSRNSAKASSYPELPCERRTDPAEPPSRHRPLAPAPALCHRKTGVLTFPTSAAPTRRAPPPTRPLAPAPQPTSTKPPYSGTGYPKGQAPNHPAAAGSGRSEPWRRTPYSLAQGAKADPSQSLLSERRHGPAERPHGTDCNQRRRFRFLSERSTDPRSPTAHTPTGASP